MLSRRVACGVLLLCAALSGRAWADLPPLGQGLLYGDGTPVSAQFSGGVALAGGAFQNPSRADTAAPVAIAFAVQPESGRVGQPADILVAAAYSAPGPFGVLPEFWFFLDAQGAPVAYTPDPAAWPAFARLPQLPATYQGGIYQGVLRNSGLLRIFVGYRAQDGAVVHGAQPIVLHIDAAAPPVSVAADRIGGDFTGDGRDDLLLRDPAQGRVSLLVYQDGAWLTLWDNGGDPEHPLYLGWAGWQVVDADRDGRDELGGADGTWYFSGDGWQRFCPACPTMALGGEFSGLFRLDPDGALRRYYYADGWHHETVTVDGPPPASLARGSSVEYGKIYGVDAAGRLFNTWFDGSRVNYGVIPGLDGVLPGSALHGRARDAYALTARGTLAHARYTDRWEVTETAAPLQAPLLALDWRWPEFEVAALDSAGQLLLVDGDGQIVAVPGTHGLRPATLTAGPWDTSLFALDAAGVVIQATWTGAAWELRAHPRSVPLLALHAGPPGAYGNLYGIDAAGEVINSWREGDQVQFGRIPGPHKLQADSLVVNANGIFGLDYAGELVRLYWDGNAWRGVTVPHGPVALRHPLIAGDAPGVDANLFGIDALGRLFSTWNNNGEITFTLVPGADGV